MKKYFLGIMAMILAVGFSAFTVTSTKINNSKSDTFTWHKFNAAGTMELSPIVTYTGTAAGAQSAFGCPEGNTVNCARAYDALGNPTVNYVKKVPQ